MEQKEFPPLYEKRQLIHDLTMQKHATGLSPPEEDILLIFEGLELDLPEQQDSCSGIHIKKEIKK